MKMVKEIIVTGAGAGVGVVQILVTKKYDGLFPLIGGYIPYPWGNYSTLGNILIGGVAFGISTFTKLLSGDIKTFLQIYGITALIGGIANGILDTVVGAFTASGNGYYTEEYYPAFEGQFYRRPESRARGFASDVTTQPMAAIPTKIPYGKILF